MLKTFPFFRQRDQMDCGPTCLQMVARFHGRSYSLPFLREISYISHEGVSLQGLMEAADCIGFLTMPVKVPFEGINFLWNVCLLVGSHLNIYNRAI